MYYTNWGLLFISLEAALAPGIFILPQVDKLTTLVYISEAS